MLYGCGFRLGEVLKLKVRGVDLQQGRSLMHIFPSSRQAAWEVIMKPTTLSVHISHFLSHYCTLIQRLAVLYAFFQYLQVEETGP